MKIICQLIYKVLCLAMLVCMTAMPAKAGERHEEPSLSTSCPEDTNTMVRTTDTVKVQLPSDSIFARYLRQQGYVITPHNQLTLLTSGMPVIRYIWNILISGVTLLPRNFLHYWLKKRKKV